MIFQVLNAERDITRVKTGSATANDLIYKTITGLDLNADQPPSKNAANTSTKVDLDSDDDSDDSDDENKNSDSNEGKSHSYLYSFFYF